MFIRETAEQMPVVNPSYGVRAILSFCLLMIMHYIIVPRQLLYIGFTTLRFCDI
jgi:hypothetical protein